MNSTDKLNRRAFLGRASLAAAAATVNIVPRDVLGMGGRGGANDQIALGIIGMGMRGNQLARNIPAGGRIAAICDANARKTAAAMKTFAADWKVFDDYRRLFDHKGIDAAIICTCDHHHVHAGVLACQAGLDVYIEKPLSNYLAEGRSLVRAARRHKRVAQTGTQQRTMEMDRFACELVRDGGIGKVLSVEAVNFASAAPYPAEGVAAEAVPAGMHWDLWQGPAPAHPYSHWLADHYTQKTGGFWGNWRDYSPGLVGGMGGHAYDMIQYALGASETGPVEFWIVGKKRPDARVDFRYANGVEVHLSLAQFAKRGPQLGAIFCGQKCKIEINRNKFTTNPKDFVKHGPERKLAAKWEGPGFIALGHLQNWLDCIKSRGTPNADVEIGHRTASIGHLINIVRRLAAEGQTVRWDPAAERFTNLDDGNKLLDRPRRPGWELTEA